MTLSWLKPGLKPYHRHVGQDANGTPTCCFRTQLNLLFFLQELSTTQAAKAELENQLAETQLQLEETALLLLQKERDLEAFTTEMEAKLAASLSEVI